MVLDGELEPKQKLPASNLHSDQEKTIYSLYLHARELLRVTKLMRESPCHRTNEHFNEVAQQIRDCQLCLDLSYSRDYKHESSMYVIIPCVTCLYIPLTLHFLIGFKSRDICFSYQ